MIFRDRAALPIVLALVLLVPGASARGQESSPRPRLQPVEEVRWSPEAKAAIAPFTSAGAASNLLKTLAHHLRAVGGIMPLARYIQESTTLPSRDRALLALRGARGSVAPTRSGRSRLPGRVGWA